MRHGCQCYAEANAVCLGLPGGTAYSLQITDTMLPLSIQTSKHTHTHETLEGCLLRRCLCGTSVLTQTENMRRAHIIRSLHI